MAFNRILPRRQYSAQGTHRKQESPLVDALVNERVAGTRSEELDERVGNTACVRLRDRHLSVGGERVFVRSLRQVEILREERISARQARESAVWRGCISRGEEAGAAGGNDFERVGGRVGGDGRTHTGPGGSRRAGHGSRGAYRHRRYRPDIAARVVVPVRLTTDYNSTVLHWKSVGPGIATGGHSPVAAHD